MSYPENYVAALTSKLLALEEAISTPDADTSNLVGEIRTALAPNGVVNIELLTRVFERRFTSTQYSDAARTFARLPDGRYASPLLQNGWETFQASINRLLSVSLDVSKVNVLATHRWDSTSVEAEFHKSITFLTKREQGYVMGAFRTVLATYLASLAEPAATTEDERAPVDIEFFNRLDQYAAAPSVTEAQKFADFVQRTQDRFRADLIGQGLPALPEPDEIKGPHGYADIYYPHAVAEIQREAFEAGRRAASSPQGDADKLAEAIQAAAVRAGIVEAGATVSGPQLVMLVNDLTRTPRTPLSVLAPIGEVQYERVNGDWYATFFDNDKLEAGAKLYLAAPVQTGAADSPEVRQAVRKVLKHHKLTEHGDGVVEADLAHAVVAALSCTPLPAQEPTLGAVRYEHARGFADALYVEFEAGAEHGYGIRSSDGVRGGVRGQVAYTRNEAADYVRRGLWRLLAQTGDTQGGEHNG